MWTNLFQRIIKKKLNRNEGENMEQRQKMGIVVIKLTDLTRAKTIQWVPRFEKQRFDDYDSKNIEIYTSIVEEKLLKLTYRNEKDISLQFMVGDPRQINLENALYANFPNQWFELKELYNAIKREQAGLEEWLDVILEMPH